MTHVMKRPRCRGTWLSVLLATLALSAGITFGAADVQINSDLPGTVQNEIRMTRSALNPLNFVVAYNDISTTLGVSYSTDGGATWTDNNLSTPMYPMTMMPLGIIFDPAIASDAQGNIYATYIAADGIPGNSGLFIERSTNSGATWSGPTDIAADPAPFGPGPSYPNYRFNDRDHLMVDAADNVLATWIKDVGVSQPTGDIWFAKSPPPSPAVVNPTQLDFKGITPGSIPQKTINDNPGGTDWANVPMVSEGAGGTIFVAWINLDVTVTNATTATLMLDRSFDAGANFGADTSVLVIDPLPKHLSTGTGTYDDARSGSYPVLAPDPNDPSDQKLYLVCAAEAGAGDEGDILFMKSSDGGSTWSSPLRVNDDSTTYDQMHPWIAVKPDGKIDVVWYDKRNSANDDAWDVYMATSVDGGATFLPNIRVSDKTFLTPVSAGGKWMGEYLDIVVDNTNAYFAFTSGVNDNFGDVFFDWAVNIPEPATLSLLALGGLALLRRRRRS